MVLNKAWDKYSNCYIFGDEENCFIVDPGISERDILSFIKKYHYNSKKIIIFLTHGHYDHFIYLRKLIVSLKELGLEYEIYIHKNDMNKLNDVNLSCASMFGVNFFDSEIISKKVNDNDILDFNSYKFKIIHTPGHTNGSISIRINNLLFTGDTLFLNGVGRTDLPTGNVISLNESIIRLMKIEEDLEVLPGHGENSRIFVEKKCNYYYNQIKY